MLLSVIGPVGDNSLSSSQITERGKPEAEGQALQGSRSFRPVGTRGRGDAGTAGPWKRGLVAGSGVAHGAEWW